MAYLDNAGLATLWAGLKEKLLLKTAVANNLTTTAAGKVLDARQGKALNDKIGLNATAIAQSASPYTHSYNATTHVHNLAGTGKLGFATLTAGYTDGDTFTVNGTAVDVVGDEGIVCDDGSVLFSVEDGTLYLYASANPFTIPDGATVMPANDVRTWLACAGLDYSAADTPALSEVLGSAGICATLMNSQNAVDYMVRSTTIQTAVLGSATAIAALDASSPFVNAKMTSNSAPTGYQAVASNEHVHAGNIMSAFYLTGDASGGTFYASNAPAWCYIKLPSPIWIYKITANLSGGTGKFQASTDGTSWMDITPSFTLTDYAAPVTPQVQPMVVKCSYVRVTSTGNLAGYALKICGKQ